MGYGLHMSQTNFKIRDGAGGNSRFVAVILALLMTGISVPVYASPAVIQTGERDKFQAVVPYDPSTASQGTEQPAVSSIPSLVNESPLSLDPAPVQNVPAAAFLPTKVSGDIARIYATAYSNLSAGSRQAVDAFLDQLFSIAFQDAARGESGANSSARDPIGFISGALANSGNVAALTREAESLTAQSQMTEESKNFIHTYVIPANEAGSDGNQRASNLQAAFNNRLQNFETSLSVSSGSAISAGEPVASSDAHPRSYVGWITAGVEQAHQNLQSQALSQPFAQASVSNVGETEAPLTQVAETVIRGQYHTVDSVFVDKNYLKTQEMANAPEEMHPYVQWVLYGRHITPENLSRYVETRRKILELFKQAKDSNGILRYRGKVYQAFVPELCQAVGTIELLQPVKG